MTMWEKYILTRGAGIQKKIGDDHAFSESMFQFGTEIPLYWEAFYADYDRCDRYDR